MMQNDEVRYPNSHCAEYDRGGLWAAKWIISELPGSSVKDDVLDEVRRRRGKPIPHIVGLMPDGNRYGFDSDAG